MPRKQPQAGPLDTWSIDDDELDEELESEMHQEFDKLQDPTEAKPNKSRKRPAPKPRKRSG